MTEKEPITAQVRKEQRQETMANIGRTWDGQRRTDVLSYAESKTKIEGHIAQQQRRAHVNHGQAAARDFLQASQSQNRMGRAVKAVAQKIRQQQDRSREGHGR